LRLLEALQTDYPALHAALGDEDFEQLCFAFIAAFPSTYPNLRWFGANMDAYLKATPPSEGSTGVFYPGEVEYIREQQRKVAGIDVEDATWDRLRALAGEYKLTAELDL